MNKLTNQFIVMLFLGLLVSCSLTTEVDLPDFKPSIVVIGSITDSNNDILNVNITKNRQILSNEKSFVGIPNSTVNLYEKDSFIGELNKIDGPNFDYTLLNYKPKKGSEYTLEVVAEGFKTASATTTIPKLAPITKIKSITSFRDERDVKRVNLVLEIDDDVNEDYYQVVVYSVLKTPPVHDDNGLVSMPGDSTKQILWSSINSISHGNDPVANYFDDKSFDGKAVEIKVEFLPIDLSPDELKDNTIDYYLSAQKISKTYYDYLSSEWVQRDTEDSPFSEPAPIKSNVENGLGVFGSYTEVSIPFSVD